MSTYKTKSLDDLEQKMQEADPDSFRRHVLKSAKDFKTSWIELGRALYAVWKDKLYKEWGYNTIDAYAAKEIGIRKQTAMKLLKSYCFLEKEEPQYLKSDYAESQDAALVPGYESVDLLRQAKNKKDLDAQDYAGLKKAIFEKGKDVQEVRKDLTNLIRERRELEPEEARQEKRLSLLKRFLGSLKSLTRELETAKLGSASLAREADNLIKKIEAEINL